MSAAEAFEIKAVEPATVSIESLQRDPELVCRAKGVHRGTVAEYAEAMRAGAVFPPVVVYRDSKGVHWLADGFHRTAAATLAGQTEIAAEVREGGRREALLYAASANAAHGLRRTSADKRRAVGLLLASFPKWSDRKIGEACGCDHKTVGALRAKATKPTGEIPHGEAQPATESDLARLSRTLRKLIARWPAERRSELRAMLDGD